jgi:hypothetical protein
VTVLTLAAIEFIQGLTVAVYQAAEVVRRDLTRTERKRKEQAKMQASVQRDLESIR